MNPNTFNISIHQLKREVDSYKQRQQEIVSFDQVSKTKKKRNKSKTIWSWRYSYNMTIFLDLCEYRILLHVKINRRSDCRWIHFYQVLLIIHVKSLVTVVSVYRQTTTQCRTHRISLAIWMTAWIALAVFKKKIRNFIHLTRF